MLETFNMFAAYNSWANRLVYAAAGALDRQSFEKDTGAFFGSMKGTLNHILVADRIWLHRFTGEGEAPKRLDEILYEEFELLRAAREAMDARITDWVAGLSEADIAGTFTYTPVTTPEPVTQRLAPALSHLFNHQTHHRGQAHMILTSLGRPSLGLDLIYFQRTDAGRQFA
ncbi:DinB family protein [Rhizobium sp. L1K21]|uniref:DinB family protein n=1 Tax=Rhizobium sp. L1K21 TaxID=2954933 RepID=UPI00209249FF|nr:DinB family protein [Rhizobium sp. L1K21]MCO6186503.1 DinB family protein [Rhizobium sp. L1K21]